jgi:hypothetical protein
MSRHVLVGRTGVDGGPTSRTDIVSAGHPDRGFPTSRHYFRMRALLPDKGRVQGGANTGNDAAPRDCEEVSQPASDISGGVLVRWHPVLRGGSCLRRPEWSRRQEGMPLSGVRCHPGRYGFRERPDRVVKLVGTTRPGRIRAHHSGPAAGECPVAGPSSYVQTCPCRVNRAPVHDHHVSGPCVVPTGPIRDDCVRRRLGQAEKPGHLTHACG